MENLQKEEYLQAPYWILSLQSKDIYNSQKYLKNKNEGYSIKDNSGKLNLRRFTMELDDSLDLRHLFQVYKEHYSHTNFVIEERNGKRYTTALVNVSFDLSLKVFNRIAKKIYVKLGWPAKDIVFQDCVCVRDNEIIAITTDEKVNDCPKVLPDGFYFEDGVIKVKENDIKTVANSKKIREELYANGFVLNGKKYVRYKRSSGSSREGNCLFILDKLYSEMYKWSECGINIDEDDGLSLSEWESYISLTLSSIEKAIELNPKNILVLNDEESIFQEKIIAVEQDEKGEIVAKEKTTEINNKIWDGEGLLDVSVFNENGYSGKGMMLLRNRFFKSCVFNTNLQQWFKDNSITDVSQLQGDTMAKNIEDIKMVVTPSSIKYMKFDKLSKWRTSVEPLFGVVKTDKPTHFFDGRMVQTNYQLINSLQLDENDVKELIENTKKYIQVVRDDIDVLKYHIRFNHGIEEDDDSEVMLQEDLVWRLLGINDKFNQTKIFKDFRAKLIKNMKKRVLLGKILVHGTNATLFGNGFEFLRSTIFPYDGKSYSLKKGQVMTTFFEYDKDILSSRSPHITMGNLNVATNVFVDSIYKYFNITNEIVCVNAINENIQQRLNGCDYDSDSMLITDNPILVSRAKQYFNDFLVPTNLVAISKVQNIRNSGNLSKLDSKIKNNKVGEIVNKSQYLNSIFWDNLSKGVENKQLYENICKLAVLSGIEIDKAKRTTTVNMQNEIKKFDECFVFDDPGFSSVRVKPLFFKNIDQNSKKNEKAIYSKFNTAMDYIYESIANDRTTGKRSKTIKFMDIFRKPSEESKSGNDIVAKNRVLNIVKEADARISVLHQAMKTADKSEKAKLYVQLEDEKNNCLSQIKDSMRGQWAMYYTLKVLDDEKCRYRWNLLYCLFNERNGTFKKLVINSMNEQFTLKECNKDEATYKLHDYYFKKTTK